MHYMPEIRRTIMIDKRLWERIADNWSKDDDGIVVPDDKKKEEAKAKEIKDEDLEVFADVSNDEVNGILDELGLGDI